MSDINTDCDLYSRETCENIPYGKHFEFFPYNKWSLHHYVTLVIDSYELAEKEKAHRVFYKILEDIINNESLAEEVHSFAQNLIKNSKGDVKKANSLWQKANMKVKMPPSLPAPQLSSSSSSPPPPPSPSPPSSPSPLSSPSPSSTVLGKRRENPNVESSSSSLKKQYCFHPNVSVPLQADGSLDILGVVKATVCAFDQKIITLGSFRSYKSSEYLLVNSEKSVKVPRESTYDAEMYRILVNWLAKVHDFEITGQWHLEGIGNDGDWHHFYCDLTIKKRENPYPEAVIELIATGSDPELRKHFDKVLNYADKLKSREVWLVHFSREDSVASCPYWPCEQLQGRGLNVVHFWHDICFTKVCMSAKFRDATGESQTIVNQQILP
ncbi:hypothetical protein RhiirB3_481718 [Rhizophagus irregularis]|nr:hypothetical protein RhiirB3_481718 [Rhizophagus irregularis]